MKFFWDNRVICGMEKAADCLLASILWLICCIPVITFVPATAALYHSVVKSVRREHGYLWRVFFRSFGENMRQGLVLSALYLIMGVILYTCIDVANAVGKDTLYGRFYYAGTFAVVILLCVLTMYLIPALSRFRMRLPALLRLSLYLAAGSLKTLVPMMFTLIAVVVACYLLTPLILFLPGVYVYFYSRSVEKAFARSMREQHMITEETESEWYYDDEKAS